jgi:hypothetical protein
MTSQAMTEAEQDLIDFAWRMLGNNLATFLLSSSMGTLQRRCFTGRSASQYRQITTYKLEIVSEGDLPGGRDPVVLAAVLHLLLTRKTNQDEVHFRDEALLRLLGWPEAPESHLAIAQAIERYFSTTYYLARKELREAGQVEVRYSQLQKLITGFDITDERLTNAVEIKRKSTVIHFAAGFVEDIATEQKYFLGIDFEELEPLRPFSWV